ARSLHPPELPFEPERTRDAEVDLWITVGRGLDEKESQRGLEEGRDVFVDANGDRYACIEPKSDSSGVAIVTHGDAQAGIETDLVVEPVAEPYVGHARGWPCATHSCNFRERTGNLETEAADDLVVVGRGGARWGRRGDAAHGRGGRRWRRRRWRRRRRLLAFILSKRSVRDQRCRGPHQQYERESSKHRVSLPVQVVGCGL